MYYPKESSTSDIIPFIISLLFFFRILFYTTITATTRIRWVIFFFFVDGIEIPMNRP